MTLNIIISIIEIIKLYQRLIIMKNNNKPISKVQKMLKKSNEF